MKMLCCTVCCTAVLSFALAACSAAPAEPEPSPTPQPVLTGNLYLDAELTEEYMQASATDVGLPKRAIIYVNKTEAEAAGMDDFVEFVDTDVDGADYKWFTVHFEDSTGLCFLGCDPGNVAYGKLATDGTVYEQQGYLIHEDDGTFTYESFE